MERGTFFLHQGANSCTRRGFSFSGGDYYWEIEILFFVSNRIATALPQGVQVFSIVNPLLSSHYGCFLLLVLVVCFYFYLFLLVVP